MISLFAIIILIHQIASSATFNVAVPMLPSVNPITNQINVGTYIGSHLYYPLFIFNVTANEFDSYFLNTSSTRAMDATFKKFRFCLKENIKFNDLSEITKHDLSASLTSFSGMYPLIMKIVKIHSENDRCIILELVKESPGLFRKLTGVASTIVKNGDSKNPFPLGAGPYKLITSSPESILLESTISKKIKFDSINFQLIKENFDHTKFQDINQLPPNEKLDRKYTGHKIKIPSLKTYNVVINLKNKKDRKTAKELVASIDWKNVFNLSVIESKKFLPWPEEKNSDSNRMQVGNTIAQKNKFTKKISILVPNFYKIDKIRDHLKSKGLEKAVNLIYISPEEFAAWAFSGKEYVALMGFDSSGSISSLEGDFSVYFESFYTEKNRIVTQKIKPIQKLMEDANDSKITSEERISIMRKAEFYLIENYFVLPIGRVERDFIFPSSIMVEKWHDFYSGIPAIEEIQ